MTTLNKLQLIARRAGAQVTIVEDEDNFFDCTNDEIHIDFIRPVPDFGFFRHLRESHGCELGEALPQIFWVFLHELGHYFTLDYCEEDDRFTREFLKLLDDEQIAVPAYQDIYFNLESEWEATEWAIGFVEANYRWLRGLR